MKRLIITIVVVLAVAGGYWFFQSNQADSASSVIGAEVEGVSEPVFDLEEYARATEQIEFNFPEDHGPHPDYQTEWWYYTGNLSDEEGNRYGYQFTIFRRAVAPAPAAPERDSEWGTRQVYFAHFAVTDVSGETFEAHEQYSRGAAGLAGAQGLPHYRVWINDWYAEEIEPGKVRLVAQGGDIGIDFILEQQKPPAFQGENGLSQKGDEVGNASYYYSLTNIATEGTITTPRGSFEITGKSWKDREWSTSLLSDNAIGWDWFALQLDDNTEVMFFFVRLEDGGVEPVSSGIVVYPDGDTRFLTLDDVDIEVLDRWTSPETGATYPSEWQVSIPSEGIDVHVEPMLNAQELTLTQVYWEGAVRIEGTHTGYGYVEMTGYGQSMNSRL